MLAPVTGTATERLLERLRRIPAGEIAATARRAEMDPRHLQRLRSGESLQVWLSTLERLAQGLGESIGAMLGEGPSELRIRPEPVRPELPALRRLLRQIEAMAEDARAVSALLPVEQPGRPATRGTRRRMKKLA